MTFQFIEYEKDGKKARIILNRPEKLNVLGRAMMEEVADAIDDATADDNIRVIILKGKGRAFSAGHDLTEPGQDIGLKPGAQRPTIRQLIQSEQRRYSRMYQTIFHCPKPTIAQIHGVCVHGAFNTQLICDITIAAEDTKIHLERLPLVVMPIYFPAGMLSLGFGERNLSMPMSARDAVRLGIINKAVPADKLEETVEQLADRIARVPSDTMELTKLVMNGVLDSASFSGAWHFSHFAHATGTLQRFRPGEYNFLRERNRSGTSGAISEGMKVRQGGEGQS